MKKLVICLSSYSPSNSSFIEKYNRQELYAIALWNLIQTVSDETEICIVENTTSEEMIENDKLKNILKNPKVRYKFFINQNDLGSINKGAGELQMCKSVLINLGEKFNQYDWIIYYTSRHIIYDVKNIEEKINRNDYEMLIGNPNYIVYNKKMRIVAPGNCNDMLFAMKSSLFNEYCSNIDPKKLVKEKMNSERYLYTFSEEKRSQKVKILDLNEIPLVRYNYAIQEMHLVSNNAETYQNFDKVLEIYLNFYKNFPKETIEDVIPNKKKILIINSIFKRIVYRLFTNIIVFTPTQYKYNIEPTWNIICKKINKKDEQIDLPKNIETSFVYQNRIDNLKKLSWK